MKYTPSARAQLIQQRTYARPVEGTDRLETWTETVDRVCRHQTWLWERAQCLALSDAQQNEIDDLREIMLNREATVSGRTLWLGGTDISKRREASQFNCAFTRIESIADIVDGIWLLMQGCGVGFQPVTGTLSGFTKPIEKVTIIRSERTLEQWEAGERGHQENKSEMLNPRSYYISVGDSAEAWSKAIGKLLAIKEPLDHLVVDLSEIRAPGIRLKGYGWISSGDETLSIALNKIIQILNQKAGFLLNEIDIIDLMNHLGTILSSRRSAEIAMVPFDSTMADEFALMKRVYWVDNPQRAQSNNSLRFDRKPSREELRDTFQLMMDGGGCEPGFINGVEARRRAPWFSGSNPCCEILLPNKGFCNLVEVDIAKFKNNPARLHHVIKIMARANYRQTCVDLRDGILQDAWHQNNQHLHLCGVGLTGIAQRDDMSDYDIMELQRVATHEAMKMADELGLPRPKNVTTVKPSGTLSKIMDTTEGVHKPLGKYIINRVVFGRLDPLVDKLRDAGYPVEKHPQQPDAVLVSFPVKFDNVKFDKKNIMLNGKQVEIECNLESAIKQLERYKKWQVNWCQQNVSNTISYSPDEVEDIVDWLLDNWDCYVGVSFLYRYDPTMRAEDMGSAYLPQTVVTKGEYDALMQNISEVILDDGTEGDIDAGSECAGGTCPIK